MYKKLVRKVIMVVCCFVMLGVSTLCMAADSDTSVQPLKYSDAGIEITGKDTYPQGTKNTTTGLSTPAATATTTATNTAYLGAMALFNGMTEPFNNIEHEVYKWNIYGVSSTYLNVNVSNMNKWEHPTLWPFTACSEPFHAELVMDDGQVVAGSGAFFNDSYYNDPDDYHICPATPSISYIQVPWTLGFTLTNQDDTPATGTTMYIMNSTGSGIPSAAFSDPAFNDVADSEGKANFYINLDDSYKFAADYGHAYHITPELSNIGSQEQYVSIKFPPMSSVTFINTLGEPVPGLNVFAIDAVTNGYLGNPQEPAVTDASGKAEFCIPEAQYAAFNGNGYYYGFVYNGTNQGTTTITTPAIVTQTLFAFNRPVILSPEAGSEYFIDPNTGNCVVPLSWENLAGKGVSFYGINLSNDGGVGWTTLGYTAGTAVGLTVSNPSTLLYQVGAFNSSGNLVAYSSIVSFEVKNPVTEQLLQNLTATTSITGGAATSAYISTADFTKSTSNIEFKVGQKLPSQSIPLIK